MIPLAATKGTGTPCPYSPVVESNHAAIGTLLYHTTHLGYATCSGYILSHAYVLILTYLCMLGGLVLYHTSAIATEHLAIGVHAVFDISTSPHTGYAPVDTGDPCLGGFGRRT